MAIPLPSPHPILDALDAQERTCPVSGRHGYRKPLQSDHRSVCPALNTMANHGYIPRNGKNLSVFTIFWGLLQCYNISYPLAIVTAFGGCFMLRKFWNIDLHEVGRHGRIEHDASLCHRDTPEGEVYGPREVVPEWAEEIIGDIAPKVSLNTTKDGSIDVSGLSDVVMDERDVARTRVRREKLSPNLRPVHAEIARGEMAIMLGVWETPSSPTSSTQSRSKCGIPFTYLLNWLVHEKLPDGWKPTRVEGLLDTVRRSRVIKTAMEEIREKEHAFAKAK